MKYRTRDALAIVLAAWLAGPAASPGWPGEAGGTGEIAILQLKVIEGDGAVHVAGSRSSRPLTVQVTDETGQPVEGAAVSFLMPAEGPCGLFSSGLPTEVLVTRSDGHASLWAIRWGRIPGRLRIRITAVKANARAGTFSEQYITSAERGEQRGSGSKQPSISKPRGKWIAIAVAAAGAAAGGLALGLTGKSQSPQPAAASQTADVQVGMPTITIGKP